MSAAHLIIILLVILFAMQVAKQRPRRLERRERLEREARVQKDAGDRELTMREREALAEFDRAVEEAE